MQDDGALSWSLEWAPYFHPSGFVNNISDAPDSMFQDGMITDTAVKRLQLLAAGRKAAASSTASDSGSTNDGDVSSYPPFFMAVGLHKPCVRASLPQILQEFSGRDDSV